MYHSEITSIIRQVEYMAGAEHAMHLVVPYKARLGLGLG